ncbi:MAG: hypothetical protein NC231_07660 [Bacillus sp. (in: Bacteria)]|nr:hypothetical protein [Bacillus sp. (in: firmicutes)]MCM1425844.1 hypothetical protein [Eubacterium sp.]
MRRFLQKQLLDVIDSMHMLHQTIKEKLERRDFAGAQTALCDEQEAAIQTGEAIEQAVGTGTEAVTHLERYCERLYQINEQIEEIPAKKAYKSLEEALIKAENAIRHMPVKKTAVFLPYKVSMWDCFESIWRAGCQDAEWECLVVPIPYFGKNEDGSLAQMQYEGDKFPADVPIVDWQQYSLEEEKPDVIFIHNPYDQYNLLTTIHPYFYASKIREYTNKLVYIPYFVHQNDMVKEDYCILPGTLYADVVVLQSERVREQYIKYYTEALPELTQKVGMQAIEQKFQALGSPKLDVIEREDSVIPEEWKAFLSQDKKVIFFNTHWTGLAKGKSEQFLKKLNWVFQFFGKREDVVLLWRPHPLMMETIMSSNPDVEDDYKKLVESYKKQKIGIYDDSPDLHRAINLSDAYYGDRSSVVEMFRQQGKPVMIMNHDIVED